MSLILRTTTRLFSLETEYVYHFILGIQVVRHSLDLVIPGVDESESSARL